MISTHHGVTFHALVVSSRVHDIELNFNLAHCDLKTSKTWHFSMFEAKFMFSDKNQAESMTNTPKVAKKCHFQVIYRVPENFWKFPGIMKRIRQVLILIVNLTLQRLVRDLTETVRFNFSCSQYSFHLTLSRVLLTQIFQFLHIC